MRARRRELVSSLDQIRMLQPASSEGRPAGRSAGRAAMAALVRQIRVLHDKAGRLRFGAARLTSDRSSRIHELRQDPFRANVAEHGDLWLKSSLDT